LRFDRRDGAARLHKAKAATRRPGKLIGATALMAAKFAHILALRAQTLDALRTRFPDLEPWWQEHDGHGFDARIESEARSLFRFGSADAI
jgi:hypothetical protein